MSPPTGPGKTSPRLINDILAYDPANRPISGFNLLTHIPPPFSEAGQYPELISARACRHHYVIKPNQTRIPSEKSLQTPGIVYKVAAVCLECRYHLELDLTHPEGVIQEPAHLHHLVYQPHTPTTEEKTFRNKGQNVEEYRFHCSYPTCSAQISVKLFSPIFSHKFVNLLTNPVLLEQRAEETRRMHGERLEGFGNPLPITVLGNLRLYIDNALRGVQKDKKIALNNKKFIMCFGVNGVPCRDLLEFVDFTRMEDGSWIPPRPTNINAPFEDTKTVFLDNASNELLALMYQRPAAEKAGHPVDSTIEDAVNSIVQLIGANYRRLYSPSVSEMPRPPYYEDLGVPEDMSNDGIIEAYLRQVDTDPDRAQYYLRCLKYISGWRRNLEGGRTIHDFVTKEYEQGKYADEDLPSAYRYFQIEYPDTLTDNQILAIFYARLSDLRDDTETRKHLWLIGVARGSEQLISAAKDTVATNEQALIFLGVEPTTPDDFIISAYAAKKDENQNNPRNQELAQRAIALIAEARKSQALQYYIQTGEMGEPEMDAAEGFRVLQIPDRTVDDGLVYAQYASCIDDNPAGAERYKQALSAIAKDRESSYLIEVLTSDSTQTYHIPADWPVGLLNIGNTCYLNSLLQFYFTLLPLRQMVLNIEKHETSLDTQSVESRKVGSRKVSRAEIQRSLKFIKELRKLFQDMITSPNHAVTPEQELARLTLLSSMNEAEFRRKSLIATARPSLGEINGRPVMGPMGPPNSSNANDTKNEVKDQQGSEAATVDTEEESAAQKPDNKENLVPESSQENVEMKDVTHTHVEQASTDTSKEITTAPEPPKRPPPVPPRPATQQQVQEEVELGAQQDVTEVINNVLFQTQCAIKPHTIDTDGEQQDVVTDLFYGKTKSYIRAQRGERSKEDRWSDIKINVARDSDNIYSAIDGAFEVQTVDVDGEKAEQYGAITRPPPILQIHVQRVQFDQVKKESFKSNDHLELKETIYMDRYMDTQKPEIIERRSQVWEWKAELRKLQAQKAELVDAEHWKYLPDVFKEAQAAVESMKSLEDDPATKEESIEIDDSVPTLLAKLEKSSKQMIEDIEAREKTLKSFIETQFADHTQLAYRLYALFVHSGGAGYGHYYIYIYDFDKEIWRKYNDGYVTEVQNPAEIFEPNHPANHGSPYFVVYVNDKMKNRLVQPVCREIAEVQSPPPASTREVAPQVREMEMVNAPPQTDEEMEPLPPYEENPLPEGVSITEKAVSVSPSPDRNRLKRKGIEGETLS